MAVTQIPHEVLERADLVQRVGTRIHDANVSGFHREGFCMSCGEVYVALQLLLGELFPLPVTPSDDTDNDTDREATP